MSRRVPATGTSPARGPLAQASSGSPAQALSEARTVLAGGSGVPPRRAALAAAIIARHAVERAAEVWCLALDPPVETTVMRHRLITMRMLGDPQVAAGLGLAWAGLSAACHRHSYELPPTAAEVSHLIDVAADALGVPEPRRQGR